MPVSQFDPFGSIPTMEEALNRFQQGAQQLGAAQTLAAANDQIQSIKTQIGDGIKQRQALGTVAQQLVMQLAGQGMNASQVANVASAITPKQYGSVDQLEIDAALSGDPGLAGVAKNLEDIRAKREDAKQQAMFRRQQALEQMQTDRALAIAGIKQQGAGKDLTTSEVEKLSNLESAGQAFTRIEQLVTQNKDLIGIFTGPLSDISQRDKWSPKYAQFKSELGQQLDAYRTAITGAGASEKEIKMLMSRLPSGNESYETFVAKLRQVQNIMATKRKTLESSLRKAGRKMGGFGQESSSSTNKDAGPGFKF
jgi:hypothetical protein